MMVLNADNRVESFVVHANTCFFVLWFVWCFYRGVLCSLTPLPDVLAPQNYSTSWPTVGFWLLVFPMVAPFVSLFVSLACLACRISKTKLLLVILVVSLVVIVYRMCAPHPIWI